MKSKKRKESMNPSAVVPKENEERNKVVNNIQHIVNSTSIIASTPIQNNVAYFSQNNSQDSSTRNSSTNSTSESSSNDNSLNYISLQNGSRIAIINGGVNMPSNVYTQDDTSNDDNINKAKK